MDLKEVKETLSAAQDYLNNLKSLDSELKKAEQQIVETAKETEKNIEVMFLCIQDLIMQTLNRRREELLKETRKIKSVDLAPLVDSRKEILEKIALTNKLIFLAEDLMKNNKYTEEFNKKSSWLGSLPQVPELKEVPFISFQYEPGLTRDLNDYCKTIGNVSRIAPVQISCTTEKPGSILVDWHSEIDERLNDIQEFRLQKAMGNILYNKDLINNFSNVYTGPDLQYLVKDLRKNQEYSFRICCKFEGCTDWSPWSLPQIAVTKLEPFSWKEDPDFLLANENRIAKPIRNTPNILIVSNGPQMQMGYSVEFTFLEVDSKSKMSFGLISHVDLNCFKQQKKLQSCNVLMEASGYIYVDNSVKSTKLPMLRRGSQVSFTWELCADGKRRINIDSQEKRVTYDWMNNNDTEMYFAALFHSPNWKIAVE